jgi:hypothetical protein
MTGFQKLSIQKAKRSIPRSVVSFAASCRFRLALETVRFGHWAGDLKGWALPIMDESPQASGALQEVSAQDERIAPTAIVLLGLAAIIFVAFLVGYQSGALHPVWQGIVSLAGVATAYMTLRLVQIIKARGNN